MAICTQVGCPLSTALSSLVVTVVYITFITQILFGATVLLSMKLYLHSASLICIHPLQVYGSNCDQECCGCLLEPSVSMLIQF